METVEDLCDHIALINKSKKILEGSKKQVKDQFKTNTFEIQHRGSFTHSGAGFNILSQEPIEDDMIRTLVKLNHGTTTDLIREVIQVTEVHSFHEKVPSMSEIFISLVKGGSHE